MRVSGACKAFQRYSMHNSLWRKLSPFVNRPINCNVLQVYVSRFQQIKEISFRFSSSVCEETLAVLAEYSNPYYFKKLHLDGCEKLNDAALFALVKKSSGLPRAQMFDKELKGGARGLTEISLSECRNIHCTGVQNLTKCRRMKSVNLLGVYNIKDLGVKTLLEQLTQLEEINLGGTSITSQTVEALIVAK